MCAPMVGLLWLINRIKNDKACKEKGTAEVVNLKQQKKDNVIKLEHPYWSLHDKGQIKEKNQYRNK